MENKYQVRQVSLDDLPILAQMEKLLFSDAWSVSTLEDCLHYLSYKSYAVVIEEKIIGYMIVQVVIDEGEILRIGVLPEFRRKHIANCLMENLEQESREKMLSRWFLEVRESNRAAIALYRKWKFCKISVRKNYYHNPKENALIMQKIME